MDYFNLLEFKKEPFSNSPEPEFLFASPQHNTCLQMLELAVRLRRGLNIVIGEVGTGKTTLCRKLIQSLSEPAASQALAIDTFLLLDPAMGSRLEFIKTVAGILGINLSDTEDSEWYLKEKIKKFLFEKGVDDQKIVVLIIDEGQKIPDECLEILREFLNYETNSFKLLQIVIFAQPEFRKNLSTRANLLDRVNFLYTLKPLSFRQMKKMIEYRISIASSKPEDHTLLSAGGLLAVYCATAGYPRKVVSLCHQIILKMIIRGKSKAGWFLVRSCVRKMDRPVFPRVSWAALGVIFMTAAVLSGVAFFSYHPASQNAQRQTRALAGIDIKNNFFSSPAKQDVQYSPRQNPELLGVIPLKKRMTIWRVLENVYGDSGTEITRLFLKANPGIKNINDMVEGTIIQVPAISAENNPSMENVIIVSLEDSRELAGLYYSYISKSGGSHTPPLQFVSAWSATKGRQFFIALAQHFKSLEEAEASIRQLSPELSAFAKVVTRWEDGTVIYNRRFFRN
jgi:general secretion pathway protein A